jgi:hypothetical protein
MFVVTEKKKISFLDKQEFVFSFSPQAISPQAISPGD